MLSGALYVQAEVKGVGIVVYYIEVIVYGKLSLNFGHKFFLCLLLIMYFNFVLVMTKILFDIVYHNLKNIFFFHSHLVSTFSFESPFSGFMTPLTYVSWETFC